MKRRWSPLSQLQFTWFAVPSIIIAGALFLLPAAVIAGEQPDVERTVVASATDNTCTSDHGCEMDLTGCVSQDFSPPYTGYYDLHIYLSCGVSCTAFQVCAHVYDDQGASVGSCHLTPCGTSCETTCNQVVCLVANQRYTLYVCLADCGGGDCVGTSCSAKGEVIFDSYSICP